MEPSLIRVSVRPQPPWNLPARLPQPWTPYTKCSAANKRARWYRPASQWSHWPLWSPMGRPCLLHLYREGRENARLSWCESGSLHSWKDYENHAEADEVMSTNGACWGNSKANNRLTELIFTQCFGFLSPNYSKLIAVLHFHRTAPRRNSSYRRGCSAMLPSLQRQPRSGFIFIITHMISKRNKEHGKG